MNARERLKQFYKKQQPTKPRVDSSLDIDHPQFDTKQYLKQVLLSQPTAGLLSTSNQLISQTRQIDGDIKTMVYDNYSKFISATQTISQMNQDAEHLDQEISSLACRITDISQRTAHLSSQFSQRRQQIELLNQQHLTLQRLQFLYDLPSRLEQLISTNRVLEAARVWARTQPLLEHYEGQMGERLAGVREDGRLIMEEVQETVRRQWRQPQTGIREGAECASLLVLLDPQDVVSLWRQYLEVQAVKLRNVRQQILDQSLEFPPLDETDSRLNHFNTLYLAQWNALVVGFASQFLKPIENRAAELLSPLATTEEESQSFVVGWQVMDASALEEAQKAFAGHLEEWSEQYEFVVDSLIEYPEDISQSQHLTAHLWQLDHYLACVQKYPVLVDIGGLQAVVDRVARKWQQQLIDSSLHAVIRDMSERLEYYFDPDVGTQHQRNSSVVSNTSVNSPTAAHARAVSSTFESLSDSPRRSSIGRRSMTRRSTLQSSKSRRPTITSRRYKPWLVATVNRQAPLHVVLADTESWLIQQILEQVNPLLEFVVQHYLDMEASQLLDEGDGMERPVLDLAGATGMRQRFIRTLDESLGTWMREWIPGAFMYISQAMVPSLCGTKGFINDRLKELPMRQARLSMVDDPVASLLLARFATDFELTLTQSIYQLCEHAISLNPSSERPQALSGGSSANVSMTNLNPLETDGSRVQSLTASWLLKDGRADSMATSHSGRKGTMLVSNKQGGGPTILSIPSTELSQRWRKLAEQLVKHFIMTVGQGLSGNYLLDSSTGGVSQYWLNICRYLKHIEEDTNALFYDPALLPPTGETSTMEGTKHSVMSNIDRLFAERVDVFPRHLSDPLTSGQIMYYLALQVTKSALENLRLSTFRTISDQATFQRLVVDVGFVKSWMLRYCTNQTVCVRALQNILDDWVATAQACCIEPYGWPEHPQVINKIISDAINEI